MFSSLTHPLSILLCRMTLFREAVTVNTESITYNYGEPYPVACPVRLINGMLDMTAKYKNTIKIAECLLSNDVDVILIKRQGHQMTFLPEIRNCLDWAIGFTEE